MRRKCATLVALVTLCIGAFGRAVAAQQTLLPDDISTRPWLKQRLAGITFTTPWKLEAFDLPVPAEVARAIRNSTTLSHDEGATSVMAMHTEFVPGTAMNLEKAADGAIANVKRTTGVTMVKAKKSQTSVSGVAAYEIDAFVGSNGAPAAHMHGVVFADGAHLYQLMFICRNDDPQGDVVWQKMKAGVRR